MKRGWRQPADSYTTVKVGGITKIFNTIVIFAVNSTPKCFKHNIAI